MEENMKKFLSLTILALMGLVLLASCANAADGNDDDKKTTTDGISWSDESNGTLTVINNTSKDMVIFQC
jgi:predicted small secreted protein